MTLSLPGFRLAFSLSAPVPFPYGLGGLIPFHWVPTP
mgnify:CR=1 FL=1|jgi:hypothetical protein